MLESISTPELVFLGMLTLISIVMIIFSKEVKFPFVGAFILGLIMVIAYIDHRDHLNKEFVLKRFQEGHAIECGLWRGERALINPKSGWIYLQGTGFIKDDQIQNDPGLCNVMGEKAPKPSTIPYAFALIVELMLVFGLRSAVQKKLNLVKVKKRVNAAIARIEARENEEEAKNTTDQSHETPPKTDG